MKEVEVVESFIVYTMPSRVTCTVAALQVDRRAAT